MSNGLKKRERWGMTQRVVAWLIVGCVVLSTTQVRALAPPPINFKGEYRFHDEESGKDIVVGSDGSSLWMYEYGKRPPFEYKVVNEGPPPPGWNIVTGYADDDDDGGNFIAGCVWAILFSIPIWWVIWKICKWFYDLIVAMVAS